MLLDLNGYTTGERPALFNRPGGAAPLQVSELLQDPSCFRIRVIRVASGSELSESLVMPESSPDPSRLRIRVVTGSESSPDPSHRIRVVDGSESLDAA